MSATLPSAANDSAAAREARVDAAIAEFLQAAEASRTPPLAEFLARHADIAGELREFLANHSAFRQFSESVLGDSPSSNLFTTGDRESLPRRLGDFELLRVIGRGGMGVVYEARRLSDQTIVATKVLHPWLALDATSLQRFQREADTAASLRHPHIIPVLASGSADGTPFLVMELIDGESLDVTNRSHKLPPCGKRPCDAVQGAGQQAGSLLIRQMADIADALQHAHERGVIHRDVKPSNLLLTRDGQMLIGDFGLARLTQQPSLTRTGEAVGSPAYMSPEQVASRGDGEPVDHRTDVYSLGATIYEILTGRPPFIADSREQLLASIQHDEPVPPRNLQPDISRDLETICLKAIRKLPSERYSTAAELAADLRRVADGQPIRARRSGIVTRVRRWVARRESARARIIALASCVVVAVGITAFAWSARHKAISSQRQQAIDTALVVALTGDLNATEDAITGAKQAGVSAEWLGVLRGQVAFHRGEYATAIEHLKSAAKIGQPTVAAVALQASAQLASGSWEKYEALLDRAESLTPKTAEDFLFQGAAEIYFDPAKAVQSLNAAVQRRDTPLARLVRAEARANLAFDTNDLPTAEAALTDAFIARDLLPDHPSALLESLNAHIVAAELFANVGRTDRRDDELASAEANFRALDSFRDLPTVIHNRALFLLLTNREAEAFEMLIGSDLRTSDPLVAYDLALALFRRGESAAALRVLQTRAGNAVAAGNEVESLTADEAFLRVLLLADTGDTPAARAAYDQLAKKYQSGLTAYFRPCLLLLLGDERGAADQSRRLRTAGVAPRLRGPFYAALLDFNGGDRSETELLNFVRGSRWDQCESMFFVGLRRFARGDRFAARQFFEQCVATRCAGFLSWDWSHAILRRWESDLEWPAWIK